MHRHPLDPLSAALGVIAVTLGVLVVTGASFDHGAGWWMAAAAAIFGLAIIPWRGVPPDQSP